MKNYSSKDDFYKKIYLILLLLTLLLSVLSVILASLSDFLIGYKCGARFLQWIDKDIKDGNILIF